MRIYMVRHGQTEFNKEKRIQGGSVDSPLTAEGIAGAKKLGQALSDISFNHVYTSPQKRAIDTAQYILDNNHHTVSSIQTDNRLKEISFGPFDGAKISEFEEAGYYEVFREHPDCYDKHPVGETYHAVTERMSAALADIVASADEDDHILIVAHSISLTCLIKFLNGIPVADYRKNGVLANTSVTVFDYEQHQYKMLKYNVVPE